VLDHPEQRTIVLAKTDPLQDAPGDSDNVHVTITALHSGHGLLVVRSGDQTGESFALDLPVVSIGRHPESTIYLDDVTVSRRHAEIHQVAGAYVVRDLGSLNGTYVDQERVEERQLSHGDELQIGKFRMVYFDGAEVSS
jgi:pSer/pThr/pTyr-binding forkhead associated (FHA) protein